MKQKFEGYCLSLFKGGGELAAAAPCFLRHWALKEASGMPNISKSTVTLLH